MAVDSHHVLDIRTKGQTRIAFLFLDAHFDRQEWRVVNSNANFFDRSHEDVAIAILAKNRREQLHKRQAADWRAAIEPCSVGGEVDDLSRSFFTLDQHSTLIAVTEMGLKSWLVAGLVPGLARQPLKKLEPDAAALLGLLRRWRDEAEKAGCPIRRIAVAFESGRDGFWLARLLRSHAIEAYVIHSASSRCRASIVQPRPTGSTPNS